MTTVDTLLAISPIDGRYRARTEELDPYLSEFGLIKHRLVAMIAHVICLSNTKGVPVRELTSEEEKHLWDISENLSLVQADIVKTIETKGFSGIPATNHDVKACEYYLRLRLKETSLADVVEMIHFGGTSEDVNNVAYALMLSRAYTGVVELIIAQIVDHLDGLAKDYANLPMLARTHGQPASPTTFGKEFAIFRARLDSLLTKLSEHQFSVKLNGASGNYDAFVVACPDVDWIEYTGKYVEKVNNLYGTNFKANLLTTQIESHDSWAEFFHTLMLLNTVLIGFTQDIWRYVSDGWIVQKPVEGEVGSSAMPHKVNPIDFENNEGNLGMANAMLGFFAAKLPISRLQRDLSDSTVERNFGVAFGHCMIAYTSILKGLGKISVNEAKVRQALNEHPEVITEAYQTILRSVGYPDPYGVMKRLARGNEITIENLHEFVHGLDVDEETKQRLLAVTPENYIGLAAELACRS